MRLTLRTLLAYRDGVLSPAETGNLHQRIRQTEVANNLLRRVENLVKHKELLAPKLIGEGLGGDANSVAEYLDDTLASEQVPEFERICIAESDLALAELAHCHQLLAEALNSKVVVPSDLRALAISLTSPQNQAALQRRLKIGKKSSNSNATDGSIRRVDNSHPEPLVTAIEVKSDEPIVAQSSQVQAPMVVSGGGSIKPQGLDLERPQLAHEVPEYLVGQRTGGWRIPAAIAAMIALMSVIAWQALGPLSSVQELFIASNSASDSNSNLESDATEESVRKPEIKNGINASADPSLSGTVPTKDADSESSTASSDAAALSDSPITEPNSDPSANPNATANDSIRWAPGPEDAKSVLFVRPSGEGTTWQRIVANAPLPDSGEICVPPSMRPTLDLAGHCSWSVCGPTLMGFSKDAKGESVSIMTSLCRAIAKGGSAGRDVTIAAPTGSVKVQFEDATSMAAIEVAFRPTLHGPITDKLAFKPFLIVVAVEGQVTVTPIREDAEGNAEKHVRLVVGEGVAFTDAQPIEFELGAIPTWYRSGNDRPLDQLAAADMNKALNDPDNLAAQLTAMCADTRPETAALAIESKMLLGDWADFADGFLNNESMRNHWSGAIGLAEQLIAGREQDADALRAAFETAHAGRGDTLFALLTGNSDSLQPKELLLKLVETLGSSELDERVLAVSQLRHLTGKDLGFQPNLPNRTVLQQWRRTITSTTSFLPLENPLWEAKKTEPEK